MLPEQLQPRFSHGKSKRDEERQRETRRDEEREEERWKGILARTFAQKVLFSEDLHRIHVYLPLRYSSCKCDDSSSSVSHLTIKKMRRGRERERGGGETKKEEEGKEVKRGGLTEQFFWSSSGGTPPNVLGEGNDP